MMSWGGRVTGKLGDSDTELYPSHLLNNYFIHLEFELMKKFFIGFSIFFYIFHNIRYLLHFTMHWCICPCWSENANVWCATTRGMFSSHYICYICIYVVLVVVVVVLYILILSIIVTNFPLYSFAQYNNFHLLQSFFSLLIFIFLLFLLHPVTLRPYGFSFCIFILLLLLSCCCTNDISWRILYVLYCMYMLWMYLLCWHTHKYLCFHLEPTHMYISFFNKNLCRQNNILILWCVFHISSFFVIHLRMCYW